MIEPIDDGGPAFPVQGFTMNASGSLDGQTVRFSGISIRDWFAGQALAGMVSNKRRSGMFEDFATDAYGFADAMLAERKRGGAS